MHLLQQLLLIMHVVTKVKEGGEAAHRAKRGVRQAVVRAAEVVACTLSSAGGDLLSLVKGPGADPSFLFNAIMIDEVQNGHLLSLHGDVHLYECSLVSKVLCLRQCCKVTTHWSNALSAIPCTQALPVFSPDLVCLWI